MSSTAPTGRQLLITISAAALVLAVVTGCASSGPGATPRTADSSSIPATPTVSPGPAAASATLGPLTITGAYIPQPASPDVAAAYLTIANSSATTDRLTKITSNVTRMVMPMTETSNGGVGQMTDLTRVTIPGHGTTVFTPDHAHLMLQNPTRTLLPGDHVTMTLTFAHAGRLTLALPVLPLSQVANAGVRTGGTSP